MPDSAQTTIDQAASAALSSIAADLMPASAAFGVVTFRRDTSGAIVANQAVVVPNGDIAWRRARAEAFEHGNIGAVVLTAAPVAHRLGAQDGCLLARFGEVDLRALTH